MPAGVQWRDRFWYTKKAAKKGGQATYSKYGTVGGDSKNRKKKWREWWEKEGKFKDSNLSENSARSIKYPTHSSDLAEFVGIMIGDGSITDYQVSVSLNPSSDRHYIDFVSDLFISLFDVTPSIYKKKNSNCVDLVVSRKKLVEFCEDIGLVRGNKLEKGLDIPEWIFSSKEWEKSCVVGIFDTGGCIFLEKHLRENNTYSYPKMSFISRSIDLRLSLKKILNNFGLSPRLRNDREVKLENTPDIKRYFLEFGSHNKKHLNRFELFQKHL